MKSFKSTAWLLPQPVLILGTYDKNGKPNAMNAAWGGQWDMHEIIISLGSHATTDNLAENPEFTVTFATADTMIASDYVGIVSGRNTPDKDDYCIECSTDGQTFSQMRVCHMPAAADEISFGIYACSPEESSFTPSSPI